jgi:hypothetical protein
MSPLRKPTVGSATLKVFCSFERADKLEEVVLDQVLLVGFDGFVVDHEVGNLGSCWTQAFGCRGHFVHQLVAFRTLITNKYFPYFKHVVVLN